MSHGVAAIDDCAGTGACVVNCNTAPCNTSQPFCAWPTFQECPNEPDCLKQQLDGAAGCGSKIQFVGPSGCSGGSGTVPAATIFECGPDSGQIKTFYYCQNDGAQPVIACVNVNAFTTLCNGCNPYTWGMVEVTATPY